MVKAVKGGVMTAIEEKKDPPAGHEGAGSGRIVELGEDGLNRQSVVNAVKGVLGLQYRESSFAATGAREGGR